MLDPYLPLVRYWTLELLAGMRGFAAAAGRLAPREWERVRAALGIAEDGDMREARSAAAREAAQLGAPGPGAPGLPLARNLEWLANAIGLDTAARRILLFAVLYETSAVLRPVLGALGGFGDQALCVLLARLLALNEDDARIALAPAGPLAASGMVRVASGPGLLPYGRKMRLRPGLADALLTPHAKQAELMRTLLCTSGDRARGPEAAVPAQAGRAAPGAASSPAPAGPYRLGVLNTDVALSSLCDGLKRHARAHLALYGPSGTGKTAFSHWLAEELGRPLLVQDVRDLLHRGRASSGLRLADVFARAGEAGAVMLFDEADALLGARACHGPWAGVQRELLDRMDACEGIVLVASRYDGLLDLAALRRFDLKVRFGYLREEDAWTLFNDLAHSLGLSAETVTPHEVGGLGRLAPGDFAAVRRQSLLHPIRDARDLYRRLRAECAFKPPADGRRAVAYAGGPAQ